MRKLTHIIHHADGSKEERETTLADLNVFIRDHLDLQLYLLDKKLDKRIDWAATLCHIAVTISIISALMAAFSMLFIIRTS